MPRPKPGFVRRMRGLAARGGPAAHAFALVADVTAVTVPPEPAQDRPYTPPPPPPEPPPVALVAPPSAETGTVYVVTYTGGRWRLEKAMVGKQNSGGAGFRSLVVPNEPK